MGRTLHSNVPSQTTVPASSVISAEVVVRQRRDGPQLHGGIPVDRVSHDKTQGFVHGYGVEQGPDQVGGVHVRMLAAPG